MVLREGGNTTDDHYANGGLVFVREYLRYRLDQWELVRSHTRKWPRGSRAISK
jgi:hypothetical protein